MMGFLRTFIRIFAFLRKEIVDVLRQPRLLLTLVIAPFLILLLVGIGYQNQARPLRMVFVAQPDSDIAKQIEQYATAFGPSLIYAGMTADEASALDRLRRGEVDVVAVAPVDAIKTVRSNQQAIFTLVHNEIDPLQTTYVQFFGQSMVDEVNRIVLQYVASQTQLEATTIKQAATDMRASARLSRDALQQADVASARTHQQELDSDLVLVEAALGGTAALLSAIDDRPPDANGESLGAQEVRALLTELRGDVDSLDAIQDGLGDYAAEIDRLNKIDDRLARLETTLAEFIQVEPNILVRPFGSKARSASAVQPRLTDYFAPAVIVLLLQHLAVTFAALSLVKERQLGTIELFRVSPLSAFEVLIGKYLSYMIFGGVISAVLTAAILFGLGVPMLGDWYLYAGVVAALLFASLSVGFFISLVSQTDSQAVQYAMIVLLASVFFSGVFLSLSAFIEPVRNVSWALPATYGVSQLQNIMLRGLWPNSLMLGGLLALGGVLFLVNLVLLGRRMARQ